MKLELLCCERPWPASSGTKLVTTMIEPARLDDLREELERVGVSGDTDLDTL